MFSVPMLCIIFLEISIAFVTVLGGFLVASRYMNQRNIQDLYVGGVLILGASTDLGMLYSQIAFSLSIPNDFIGFKIFLVSILLSTIIVWFHLANIYGVRSRIVTSLVLAAGLMGAYLLSTSHVMLVMQEGVIMPLGQGGRFNLGTAIMAVMVGLESVFAVLGLRRIEGGKAARYRISRTAGVLFFVFLVCLFTFFVSKTLTSYFIMWIFAFFAMLYMALFSLVTEDSDVVGHPLNFFRTRILFKLVITLVLMIVISLEGMGIISIGIAKSALSASIMEGYRNVAEDTTRIMSGVRIGKLPESEALAAIEAVLERTRIGTRGSIFVVSPDGTVFINRENKWISLGRSPSFTSSMLMVGKSGAEIDVFGEKVIGAYIPLKGSGWGMIVGQPIAYAYSRLRQMEGTFIIFMLLWIAVTVFIGVMLARNIEDPIKVLKQGIGRISQGDLTHKITLGQIDELGQLSKAINVMTDELKSSQESLIRSERLASLGFMAAGMAHEIKNALVPLKTLTELLAISGKDEAFIAKFNELVPKEIERINTLSSDLLHYSRPTAAVFEPVDLNGVADESVKFMAVQAHNKGIKIMRDLRSTRKVRGDRQKLMEAFTNIILNAIEAMNGGEITVSTSDSEDGVMARISDNGPGISEENLKRIFVPFFTTKKEGTGMGLAITQKVIADQGGAIELVSSPGKGTTFTIFFAA